MMWYKGREMAIKTLNMSDNLYNYYQQAFIREPILLSALREETTSTFLPPILRNPEHGQIEQSMLIPPEEGAFIQFLLRLTQAKHTIEIGTYTGYSTLFTALELPENGHITACDISGPWLDIAKKYWKKASVNHKIDLHIAPAEKTLNKLINEGKTQAFDFIFIDADKVNYNIYYEQALVLIKPNGLIAIDNLFWAGGVSDPKQNDPETTAVKKLNKKLAHDQHTRTVKLNVIPIGDGLGLVQKL